MDTLADQIKQLGKPDSDELEITTIGVGGFEGESIVVHLGNGKWCIVDSCKSQDGTVLPLFYLQTLEVPSTDIVRVICTHWHSDHIGGLSEIIKTNPSADFFYPIVGQKNNLLQYLVKGDKAQGRSSVWNEFLACLKTADKAHTNWAMSNTMIYDDHGVVMVALSPSEKMLSDMEHILLNFDANHGDVGKINENMIKPNMSCSALLLYSQDCCVLLGADLEANRNKKKSITSCVGTCGVKWERGWCNVIKKSVPFQTRKASFFKLPHHSSKTGYCPEIWANRVEGQPVSVSTIFINNAGIKLPKKNMLNIYHQNSSAMYLTSSGPKKKDRNAGHGKSKLDENKSEQLKSIAVMKEEKGIVCSRKKPGHPWNTQLLGTALLVNESFIRGYQD